VIPSRVLSFLYTAGVSLTSWLLNEGEDQFTFSKVHFLGMSLIVLPGGLCGSQTKFTQLFGY